MPPPLALLLLALLALLPPAPAANLSSALRRPDPDPCRSTCRFLVCRGFQTSLLSTPARPVGPTICRRGQDIENILRTGEARVVSAGQSVRISRWRPPGLQTRFPRDYLFTRPIPGRGGLSGLARRHAHKNQNRFLDNVCVRLPITSYERNVAGRVVRVATNDKRDCLSVLLRAPDIVIEAFWFSGDDMDLAITEPGGGKIDNRNKDSPCGSLLGDNNVDACGVVDSGFERVVYYRPCDDFKKGLYTATLRHGSNCQFGPTTYEIRVVVNGRLQKNISGVSNRDGGQKIASVSFRLS